MSRTAWGLLVLLALAALTAALWGWWGEGVPPRIAAPAEAAVGRTPRPLAIELFDEGTGLRSAEVVLVHPGGEVVLLERRFAGRPLLGGGPGQERLEIAVDAAALELPEGSVVLRVSVRDWSLAGLLGRSQAVVELPVDVDLTPPRVAVESGLTYVQRGGAAAVVYRVNEPTARDGVMVGEVFYRGFPWERSEAGCLPLAGADGGSTSSCRAALFAVAVDAPPQAPIRVVAEDRAGNAGEATWATRLQERSFPEIPVRLPPSFLERKVPELARALRLDSSEPMAAFRVINSEGRARDEERVRQIAGEASAAPLWQGAFLQLPNSKVTSLFAERRLYLVGGEAVSRATHFGFDLASTAHAEVPAANAGRVLFAGELGIYGQAVVIDHGLGLTTLYGHLSRIDVEPGQAVEKGTRIGRSGESGLAGGDHLHFATLVGPTYTDPREWWDPQWVREHVDVQLGR